MVNNLEYIKKQYWSNNDNWIFQVKIGGHWIELDDYEACRAYPKADYRLRPIIPSFEDIDIPDNAYCYGENHPGAIYLSSVKCNKFATFHGYKYSVPHKAWISLDMWSADPFEVKGHYLISLKESDDHILRLNGINSGRVKEDWFETYEDVSLELVQNAKKHIRKLECERENILEALDGLRHCKWGTRQKWLDMTDAILAKYDKGNNYE